MVGFPKKHDIGGNEVIIDDIQASVNELNKQCDAAMKRILSIEEQLSNIGVGEVSAKVSMGGLVYLCYRWHEKKYKICVISPLGISSIHNATRDLKIEAGKVLDGLLSEINKELKRKRGIE